MCCPVPGGVPLPDLAGVCPVIPGWGTPPHQTWLGYPPIRPGWGTPPPPSDLARVTPPGVDRLKTLPSPILRMRSVINLHIPFTGYHKNKKVLLRDRTVRGVVCPGGGGRKHSLSCPVVGTSVLSCREGYPHSVRGPPPPDTGGWYGGGYPCPPDIDRYRRVVSE